MRIKLTVSYDGTDFCGWQVQNNGVSVQGVLEEAIFKVTGEKVRVTGSGRTDAGVHAAGQVAHFDTGSAVPPEKFYKAINVFLPPQVKVIASEPAEEDFHACNSAKKKTYVYSMYISDVELPLKERYAVRIDKADVNLMNSAAKEFLGEHDFSAYKASGSSAKTTVRNIYSAEVIERDGNVFFRVCGNGFLYNMVRIMTGAIVAAGKGEITAADVKLSLENGVRPKNVKTFPANGLCLVGAEYEQE